ncbi:PAS domain-containing protein [Kitasatospora sp. NPDC088346]|uniref:hybrid sensor histidine kinase/response regulator n=1 Tax=Kitasatospora sp. NPDC088346 TaxID=3364073 RepID=UPI0037F72C4E
MSSRPTRGAARLAAILDALPDALLLVNSNGTVVEANKAAVQSLQAPGTSLVGRGVLDLLPEFDPSRIPGSMRPKASEPERLDQPVRMTARRTDGSSFPVEVAGNDFEDDRTGGDGLGYLSYDPYRESGGGSGQGLLLLLVRDVSGRLGVEAELRRQHKQTEMILRAAAEGVLGVDLDGRVVLVNPAAAHILDYRASELGGRELHPLIQHSQADGSPLALEGSALLDTLTSGRKHRVRGTVLWRKDGTPVTVDLTTAPVRDGDQLVGAVMTFTDRTRELALVARNEHLTAVLEQELGDALTALHRRIDALAGDPAGQLWPEANWTLRRLADECRRFSTLIDGVLAHQRFEVAAENGKDQTERAEVGLDTVVQKAVEFAGELVGPGRVRYSVHAAPVELSVDRDRLARALAHLVADVSGVTPSLEVTGVRSDSPGLGVPALPPGGTELPMVVLAAAQRGEVARIEVRGPSRRPSAVHLPIARTTVEHHGGVLQRHELPNRAGTTYVVELPLDPSAPRAARTVGVPKETDTAMLPDLPQMSSARPGEPGGPAAARPKPDQPAEEPPARPAPTAQEPASARDSGREDAAAAEQARPGAAPQPRTPIALGPAEGPAPDTAAPAAEPTRPSRRRRGLPAGDESSGALSIPGVPDPGTALYPGLENALPVAAPVPAQGAGPEGAPAARPTGRRRRLAVPGEPAEATAPAPVADPQPERPAAELELARPARPELPSASPAGDAPEQPRPVGSGLGELAPPRPMGGGFAGAFPSAFPDAGPQPLPQPDALVPAVPAAVERPALPALPPSGGGSEAAEAAEQSAGMEPRTPPRPVSELPMSGVGRPGEQPSAAVPADPPTMVAPAADGARRLLVWPEPDPSTRQALEDRGYRPVIVRSREEVDAQVSGFPAALFVDPLTGPITRTALQSLRTAALNSRVPVLVTAGLGQATRDAAYGADPAVLLRALAPRDGENHAARVLLVESDPDIAAALTSSLERRGMHVEHALDENDAVSRASSVQPNLVVMDLLQVRRRRVGLLDWLRANDRLHRTPLVVYTSVDLDPQELPRLRTGETVLFLAERSTTEDVQSRIVDLLGRIGAMGEVSTVG